ncbi:nicotinic acid mononucleotide adenylyltransferase [Candidatus Nitrosoglobus terrae]|uniref:Probable nicotinate-nucleotide adenylyltransferase n=1 Tax=Candidatus Nitrosoglobus terrae TaxID=1630141 RepID=A0A1Q2SL98_9GAMM|nr:nicotinic acid mononucleotide adenylyltransferase [Candidatus Nitrosoglobus terrae]
MSLKRLASKSSNSTVPIGIFGGTFDPVHFGHLRPALELLERLFLAEIRFIPCRCPPHRPLPVADPEQRLAMLQLGIAGESRFKVDDREFYRSGPSYMVDTLISLRAEKGQAPLCLILGTDAFLGLPKWYRWLELIELAHLLVIKRPGEILPQQGVLKDLLDERKISNPKQLKAQSIGCILPMETTQLGISATQIRVLLKAGQSVRYLLPDAVWNYIQTSGLYSSSVILEK